MDDDPQGGGALAATTIAFAARLVADAAGRAAVEWEAAPEAQTRGLALARSAVALGAIDDQAYRGAVAALSGDVAAVTREARNEVVGDMLDRAAEAPLALARTAADVVVLAGEVARRAPVQAAADATAAAVIAAGAARAVAHLISVNLVTREDDPRLYQARQEVSRATAALPKASRSTRRRRRRTLRASCSASRSGA